MVCAGFKRNGQPCAFKCKPGSLYCGHHQPRDCSVPPPPPVISVPNNVHPKLAERLPVELQSTANQLLLDNKISLCVTNLKVGTLGLWTYDNGCHIIYIKNSLYGVDFLCTFIHEVAHATHWDSGVNVRNAHGKEWKAEYHKSLRKFINLRTWTDDEKAKLMKPAAVKKRTLAEQKAIYPGAKFVCELSIGEIFSHKGLRFIVKNRGRGANIYCQCLDKLYDAPWKFPRFFRL